MNQLADIGLGWMGWTEEEVLFCDVNALVIAHRGRVDMLQRIFGKSNPPPSPPRGRGRTPPTGGGGKVIKFTPKLFDAMFGSGKRKR